MPGQLPGLEEGSPVDPTNQLREGIVVQDANALETRSRRSRGRPIDGKAVAAGLPTVVTPAVMDGLPRQLGAACAVGATAEAFAARVIDLLATSDADRCRLTQSAALSDLSWSQCLAPLERILQDVVARGHV